MIYVNGDSFTQKSNGSIDYSWPILLEKTTQQTVLNQAAGCGSNSRMLSNLQDLYSLGIRPEIVLIGLTTYSRWHVPAERFGSWNIGPTVINDRTGQKDESMLKWWLLNAYNRIEFVRQYYNQIWQMHNFCQTHLNCPIIFFNAHDVEIEKIQKEIFGTDETQKAWVLDNVDDPSDQYTQDYITAFQFYREEYKKWIIKTESWMSFLQPNYIDPPGGEHADHPSRQGHRLICDYVLSIIKETLPNTYQKWSNI